MLKYANAKNNENKENILWPHNVKNIWLVDDTVCILMMSKSVIVHTTLEQTKSIFQLERLIGWQGFIIIYRHALIVYILWHICIFILHF